GAPCARSHTPPECFHIPRPRACPVAPTAACWQSRLLPETNDHHSDSRRSVDASTHRPADSTRLGARETAAPPAARGPACTAGPGSGTSDLRGTRAALLSAPA